MIPQDKQSKERLNAIGFQSVFPLDSYLGIANLPFKLTPTAMLKVVYWAQNQLSYQRAEEAVLDVMKVKVNDDTIRAVTDYIGSVVFDNDSKEANSAISMLDKGTLELKKNKKGVLYIQMDGAAINTRVSNEEGSTWRENKLCEVFSSNDIYYWHDHKGKKMHQIRKKLYSSYIGSATEFKKYVFATALRGGYGEIAETVVLSDGATWIRNLVEELFPDAQHILDYYHLCENINTYAKYLFNQDDSKYKPWAQNICETIKKGEYQKVLNELSSKENAKKLAGMINLPLYIKNNERHINYPEYIERGYFIGSGAIESGNKIVLQDRLKRAGMRWNVKTAQYLLTLKAKAESNLWHQDVELPFLEHCKQLSGYRL